MLEDIDKELSKSLQSLGNEPITPSTVATPSPKEVAAHVALSQAASKDELGKVLEQSRGTDFGIGDLSMSEKAARNLTRIAIEGALMAAGGGAGSFLTRKLLGSALSEPITLIGKTAVGHRTELRGLLEALGGGLGFAGTEAGIKAVKGEPETAKEFATSTLLGAAPELALKSGRQASQAASRAAPGVISGVTGTPAQLLEEYQKRIRTGNRPPFLRPEVAERNMELVLPSKIRRGADIVLKNERFKFADAERSLVKNPVFNEQYINPENNSVIKRILEEEKIVPQAIEPIKDILVKYRIIDEAGIPFQSISPKQVINASNDLSQKIIGIPSDTKPLVGRAKNLAVQLREKLLDSQATEVFKSEAPDAKEVIKNYLNARNNYAEKSRTIRGINTLFGTQALEEEIPIISRGERGLEKAKREITPLIALKRLENDLNEIRPGIGTKLFDEVRTTLLSSELGGIAPRKVSKLPLPTGLFGGRIGGLVARTPVLTKSALTSIEAIRKLTSQQVQKITDPVLRFLISALKIKSEENEENR